jgi:hypothetical protein
MRKVFLAAIAMSTVVLGGAWMAGGADAPSPLKVMKAGDLGEVLTGPSGMTLYTSPMTSRPGRACAMASARRTGRRCSRR